jgi:hypothetical protein
MRQHFLAKHSICFALLSAVPVNFVRCFGDFNRRRNFAGFANLKFGSEAPARPGSCQSMSCKDTTATATAGIRHAHSAQSTVRIARCPDTARRCLRRSLWVRPRIRCAAARFCFLFFCRTRTTNDGRRTARLLAACCLLLLPAARAAGCPGQGAFGSREPPGRTQGAAAGGHSHRTSGHRTEARPNIGPAPGAPQPAVRGGREARSSRVGDCAMICAPFRYVYGRQAVDSLARATPLQGAERGTNNLPDRTAVD